MTIEDGIKTMELFGTMDLSKLSVDENITVMSATMDFAEKVRGVVLKHTGNSQDHNQDADLIEMLRKVKQSENE